MEAWRATVVRSIFGPGARAGLEIARRAPGQSPRTSAKYRGLRLVLDNVQHEGAVFYR